MITLSPQVRDVLSRCIVTNQVLILPTETMSKELVEDLTEVIKSAGGVWGRKSGGYLFASDPRLLFDLPGATPTTLPPPVVVDLVDPAPASATTPVIVRPDWAVTALAVSLASVQGMYVLDPHCGDGAIARACYANGAAGVTCVDHDAESLAIVGSELDTMGNLSLYAGDFLQINLRLADFERVVVRPPRHADLAYVQRSLKFLAPKGILVAVLEPHFEQRGFLPLIHQLDYDLEKDAFPESVILTLRNK